MIMNHSNIRKVEQIDGRTVLLLAVCACFTSFLSTSLLGHGLYMIWLFLLLCYFELFTMGLGMLGVYILSVVWLAINTKYHISFPSPLLFHMLYRLLDAGDDCVSDSAYTFRQTDFQYKEVTDSRKYNADYNCHAPVCSHPCS